MDLLPLFEGASKNTSAIVAGIKNHQLGDPTPCSEWDCRTVLNHMIGTNYMWAALAKGQKVEAPHDSPDFAGDDPAGAYDKSVQAALEGFKSPGVENVWDTPIGQMPGTRALGLAVFETVVHGWDLAKGSEQDAELPSDLAGAVDQMARAAITPEYRQPKATAFGPELEAPPNATQTEKLMAFLGRS